MASTNKYKPLFEIGDVVTPITYDKEGNIKEIHLAPDAANGDWIRANRLKNSDKPEDAMELEELFLTPMMELEINE